MAYLPLSTANLPDPVIDPAQGKLPAKYFDTFLYTGNGGGLQVGDVIKKPADTTTISNSLIFDDGDSPYLSYTPSTSGDQKKWTFSAWVKRGVLGTQQGIFSGSSYSGNDGIAALYFYTDDTLYTYYDTSGTNPVGAVGSSAFKDTSTWYHIVWAVDAANTEHKIWVNGLLVSTVTGVYPPNFSYGMNRSGTAMGLGTKIWGPSSSLDGYMAEVHYCDGQYLDASDFGNFDANGIWIPKAVTGITYGTNGFYLDFSDNTSTTTLGEDQTANGNDWTLNNFATTDQVDDSPTDNIPYNISVQGGSVTISEGNLKTNVSTDNRHARSAMRLPPTGKWYWEAEILVTNTNHGISIVNNDYSLTITAINIADSVTYNVQNGIVYAEADGGTSYATAPVGNVVGVAFDSDTGRIWFRNTAGWLNSGDPAAGTGYVHTVSTWGQEDWFPAVISHGSANKQTLFNFGQRAFTHTVPTGFSAMSENNITVNETNLESPDFVWIKNRDQADQHHLYDSVRGIQKALYSSATTAETDEPNGLLDFNANGFTIGSEVEVNTSAEDYVSWTWKANGSGVSNTDGSITSTVSANTESGFSIVGYTGTQAAATVGHGLSQAPEVLICKARSRTNGWPVYHKDIPSANQYILRLNSTGAYTAAGQSSIWWNNTSPTSSVFSLGANDESNASGHTQIAYCFHSVEGFSKFGSFELNNNADGPFVYLGFRPALVITKRIDGVGDWNIFDSTRDAFNDGDLDLLQANTTTAESAFAVSPVDLLSNGFKLRHSSANGYINAASDTAIYMAFAENPFKYSNAR